MSAIDENLTAAIVLLSGGMDSATCLALAQRDYDQVYGLSVNYGQRHSAELVAAEQLAKEAGLTGYRVMRIDISDFGGSALLDPKLKIPERPSEDIPITYVPARNTIMLSVALSWAEAVHAKAIYLGVNAVDYSGYPDCRGEYIQAFQGMADLATKAGIEGHGPSIKTPLLRLTKGEIIQLGTDLGVDFSLTVTCYQADQQGLACDLCDACRLRNQGFRDAKLTDVTRYQSGRS